MTGISDSDRARQIARGKELLASVLHAAMATVNEDGTPHNTPYFFMIDHDLRHLYWGSHPDSVHSRNIVRTGRLFVVLFSAYERGGLYIEADGGHILEGDELDIGLELLNARRAAQGEEPLGRDYYVGDKPQRMWGAKTLRFWVNGTRRGPDGLITQDIRTEVGREDLLGAL